MPGFPPHTHCGSGQGSRWQPTDAGDLPVGLCPMRKSLAWPVGRGAAVPTLTLLASEAFSLFSAGFAAAPQVESLLFHTRDQFPC